MDVSDAGVLAEAMEAADLEVFTDDHDLLGNGLGDGQLGAVEFAGLECLDVGRVVFGDGLGNILDEIDKDGRLGGKVGLGVDLDGDADAVLDGGIGHALALSMSPSVSTRAFLQSIMPTLVISRRVFTSAAVNAIVCFLLCIIRQPSRPRRREPRCWPRPDGLPERRWPWWPRSGGWRGWRRRCRG